MSSKISIAIYRAKFGITIADVRSALLNAKHEEQTSIISIQNWNFSVFYSKNPSPIKWKSFISTVIDPASSALQFLNQKTERLIVCFENVATQSVYACAFGAGYFSIADQIDPDFGISILSKLVKKDQDILKSTREANISGGIFGEIKFFRTNYKFNENDNFGSFYQEVQAIIDKSILTTQLGFAPQDIKKDNLCIAKNSFKINKSINFTQLAGVLNGLEWIEANLPSIEINNVRKLSPIIDKKTITRLRLELLKRVFSRYAGRSNAFQFDLCHREFEKYLTAGYYQIKNSTQIIGNSLDSLNNFDQLKDELLRADGRILGLSEFYKKYRALAIEAYGDDSSLLTKGSLSSHLIADIKLDSNRYFYIDESWYQISPKYIEKLDVTCNEFINGCYHKNPIAPWGPTTKSENDYNYTYLNRPDSLVFDKVLNENIELCDFMAWTNDAIYLYHAKIGVGNTMRDLCSQIAVAAERLKRDQQSGNLFLRGLYQSLKAKIGSQDKYFDDVGKQTLSITEDQFVALFEKNPIFVLLVKDSGSRPRAITNMGDFNSNIAKLSISELFKKMRAIGCKLEIIQA